MKMSEQEVHLIHDLWDVVKSYSSNKDHEIVCEELLEKFDNKVGLIHGDLDKNMKVKVLNDFFKKKINILVSTTVIEVGIDIKSATTMIIEHAERFGLAQLHQLRGRVGRNNEESYCILLHKENINDTAKKRLNIMTETNDGFLIAEEDLKIRGPGDHIGTKQSGLPNLNIATINDYDILSIARNEAIKIIEKDPELNEPELKKLKAKFLEYSNKVLIETNYS